MFTLAKPASCNEYLATTLAQRRLAIACCGQRTQHFQHALVSALGAMRALKGDRACMLAMSQHLSVQA